MKNSLYFLFFSFPFYLFVAFFHAVIFALVQPAMEGVEVRIPVEAQEGVLSYWFCCDLWFCGGQSALCLGVQ